MIHVLAGLRDSPLVVPACALICRWPLLCRHEAEEELEEEAFGNRLPVSWSCHIMLRIITWRCLQNLSFETIRPVAESIGFNILAWGKAKARRCSA